MPFVDVILLGVVLTFAVLGFAFGFVHTLGSLAGTIVGVFVASRLTGSVSEHFGVTGGGGQVFVFIVIFLIVSRILGILFWIAEKVWDFLSWIPFAGALDRIFGVILGIFEGVIIAAVIAYYSIQILPDAALRLAIEHSFIAQQLLHSITLLQLLFPEELRMAFQ